MATLAILLAIAWALLASGSRQAESFPSAASYGPSGLAAFAELARRAGYRVRIDAHDPPSLQPSDLAVCATIEGGDPIPFLLGHLQRGGRVLALPVARSFAGASARAESDFLELTNADGGDHAVSRVPERFDELPSPLDGAPDDTLALWYGRYGHTFAQIGLVERGVVAAVCDGLPATNRFLAAHDNAGVLLAIVQAVAPEGGDVVFVEASFGNAHKSGLLATIGPWAAASGAQVALLLLLAVAALGRRFGLPVETVGAQKGAREFVEAMAHVYRRGRATPIALGSAWQSADRRLRSELGLPAGTPDEELRRLLPPGLASALGEAKAGAAGRMPEADALRIAQRLEARLAAFLAESGASEADHRL